MGPFRESAFRVCLRRRLLKEVGLVGRTEHGTKSVQNAPLARDDQSEVTVIQVLIADELSNLPRPHRLTPHQRLPVEPMEVGRLAQNWVPYPKAGTPNADGVEA